MTNLFGTHIEQHTVLKPTTTDIGLRIPTFLGIAQKAFAPCITADDLIVNLVNTDVLFYGRKNDQVRYFWRD